MNFFMKSDIGKIRQTNQDAICGAVISKNCAWIAICDGMGGINGGDIASKIVTEKITQVFENDFNEKITLEKLKKLMEDTVKKANLAVYEEASKNTNYKNMGTTLVLAVILFNKIHIIYVGDSRLYIINKKRITQITSDHSVVWDMVKNNQITIEEAKIHPQKNVITKAVGIANEIEADFIERTVEKNDIILVCTDGLTNQVNDEKILEIFEKNKACDIPEKLIEDANSTGGNDNITVGILEINSL